MDFVSTEFVAFVLVALFFHRWQASTWLSEWVFAAINLAFLARHARSPSDLMPFFGFVGLGYVTHLVSLQPRGPIRRVWPALPLIVVALFVYLKQYSICSLLPRPPIEPFTLGMSFILFRMMQVMIDTHDGEIRAPVPPLRYFNFTCSFITLVSGPLQRYQDFTKQSETQRQPIGADACADGLSRMVSGYLKTMLWATLAKQAHGHALTFWSANPTGGMAIVACAGACGAYLLFLFFNFSGYTDIVIGIGRWFGWQLPENFAFPFACSNFIDLWARWHASLSNWFKVYVYNPLLKAMVVRFPSPGALPYLGCIAYFVTFFLMGIWHGTTNIFVAYGLVLGAGVSINKLYQVVARRTLGKRRYDQLAACPLYCHVARGMAIAYFAAALIGFWISPEVRDRFLEGGIPRLVVGSFAVLTLAVTIGSLMYELVAKPATAMYAKLSESDGRGSSALRFAWLTVRVVLLVGVILTMGGGTPDFVYKAF